VKIWLRDGWIHWLPTTLTPGLNFIGVPGQGGSHGGFRRIVGVVGSDLILETKRGKFYRLTYVEGDFEGTVRLVEKEGGE